MRYVQRPGGKRPIAGLRQDLCPTGAMNFGERDVRPFSRTVQRIASL
jgi:hypothetical protein